VHTHRGNVTVNYYDSSIPGLGFSIKGFIDGGTTNLVNLIGSDGSGLGFPNSNPGRQIPRALYAAAVCSGNKPDFRSTIIRVKSPVSSQAAMNNTSPVACT
jgi:hypothetical protein